MYVNRCLGSERCFASFRPARPSLEAVLHPLVVKAPSRRRRRCGLGWCGDSLLGHAAMYDRPNRLAQIAFFIAAIGRDSVVSSRNPIVALGGTFLGEESQHLAADMQPNAVAPHPIGDDQFRVSAIITGVRL